MQSILFRSPNKPSQLIAIESIKSVYTKRSPFIDIILISYIIQWNESVPENYQKRLETKNRICLSDPHRTISRKLNVVRCTIDSANKLTHLISSSKSSQMDFTLAYVSNQLRNAPVHSSALVDVAITTIHRYLRSLSIRLINYGVN